LSQVVASGFFSELIETSGSSEKLDRYHRDRVYKRDIDISEISL